MNDSIYARWIIGSARDNEGLPKKLYNGFEVDWDMINSFEPETISHFLDSELERFIAFNQSEKEHRRLFCNYLKVRIGGLERWGKIGRGFEEEFGDDFIVDVSVWDNLGQAILNYCEETTEPQPEPWELKDGVEKLRTLYHMGVIDLLNNKIKENKGGTNARALARVLEPLVGMEVETLRKYIDDYHKDTTFDLETKSEAIRAKLFKEGIIKKP